MELLEWDARTYDTLPLPHVQWGERTQSRLRLAGDETVLELGSGTGRDAARLLDAVPDGRVIAVDGSEQMLEQLAARLPDRRDRLTVRRADLRAPGALDGLGPVDAVMSVATLHWLPDHEVVFGSVASVLRPGGRFAADAGGFGNTAAFRRALITVAGDDGGHLWNFAGVEETTARLRAAGFTDIEVRLRPDPAVLERGEQLEAFLATIMVAAYLRELLPSERRPFVRAVADAMEEPVIDYVRLELTATRR